MNERVLKFGKDDCLVGVLSSGREASEAPVALMFNAGYLHRVGPNRLWVSLARELARKNIPSLRFDLGGLGDSALPSNAGADLDRRALDCVVAAMDAAEKQLGKRDFIVYGLCSGAYYAHEAARLDRRVRAAALIDGYAYETSGFYSRARLRRAHHLARRALSLRAWSKFYKRRLQRQGDESPGILTVRPFRDQETVQADILSFLEAGQKLHYIYSGGLPHFNHEKQFWEMFSKLRPCPGLSCSYFRKADHTFSFVPDRNRLIAQLSGFADNPLGIKE